MTRELRLALFGDGRWAADSLRRVGQGPHRVVAAVGRVRATDSSFAEAAAELGIPLLQPTKVNHPDFVGELGRLDLDLGISLAYDQIFGREILRLPRLGYLNLHAGMLPRYRGRNVVNWAIINGEREIGVTAHLVDEGIDTGDILIQRSLPIGWTDTYGDVLCRLVQVMPGVMEEAVGLLASGSFAARPQTGVATYFGAREDGDEWLNWSDTSTNLHNKIRGISRPGIGARSSVGDQMVTIWRAHFDPSWPSYIANPGQVVGRRPGEGVLVKTGDSVLLLKEVQSPDREPVIPSWPIGTRLGPDLGRMLRGLQARVAELEARHAQENSR